MHFPKVSHPHKRREMLNSP